MYKLMLVDDDVPMLRYIERLIDWEEVGIELVGSAYSSEMALEDYPELRPDIVVTDIGMPYMNGIELAQELRRMDGNVRIVFLTCHEDFSYSKQAFQLEADDYLIKDELTRDQLKLSLLKAVKQLQHQEVNLERLSYREDMARNKDVLKTKFLEQMLGSVMSLDTVLGYGRRLGLSLKDTDFLMSIGELRLDDLTTHYSLKDFPLVLYAVFNITEELAEGQYFPFLYKNQLVLLWNGDRHEQMVPAMRTFAESIIEKVRSFLKIGMKWYVSEETVEARELGTCYEKLQAGMLRYYYDDRAIHTCGSSGGHAWTESTPEAVLRDFESWKNAVLEGEKLPADLAMHNVQRKAAQLRLHPQRLIDLGLLMAKSVIAAKSLGEETMLLQDIACSRKCVETLGLIANVLTPEQRGDVVQQAEPRDPKLETIDHYLEAHIHEMVTSLDIANYLHLNPSYFSRYFKSLTQTNFTDYMHQYKINLAIKLLQKPEETVENVAYSLGYSDRAYFSKVFKKYSGKSPSLYKATE